MYEILNVFSKMLKKRFLNCSQSYRNQLTYNDPIVK